MVWCNSQLVQLLTSSIDQLRYAMGQTFVTHGDNRRAQFHYPEVVGNTTAVVTSNAYNPDTGQRQMRLENCNSARRRYGQQHPQGIYTGLV